LYWWPVVGFGAMIVLGLAIGPEATPLDRWFWDVSGQVLGRHPLWMLLFNRVWVLVPLLLLAIGIAARRRQWRLAVVVALCPVISIAGARLLKQLFDRPWPGDSLAYPSGHTTVAITVAGMLVLVIGVRVWTLALATIGAMLPSIGMASNHFHFITDIIGATFYATAMVCLAVLAAGPDALDRALGAKRQAARVTDET